jgi:hypothetical protein
VNAKDWLDNNGLKLNLNKTELLQFQTVWNKNPKITNLDLNDSNITPNNTVKFLGIMIDDELRFVKHVDYVCKKLSSVIFALGELRYESDFNCLLTLYHANFHCNLKYGVICWGNSIDSHRVFLLQKWALRKMFFKNRRYSCKNLFQQLGILPFPCVYIYECIMFVKKNESRFREHEINHGHNTRHHKMNIAPKYSRLEIYRNGPFQSCLRLYNKLPVELKSISPLTIFSQNVKRFLLQHCFYSVQSYIEF